MKAFADYGNKICFHWQPDDLMSMVDVDPVVIVVVVGCQFIQNRRKTKGSGVDAGLVEK